MRKEGTILIKGIFKRKIQVIWALIKSESFIVITDHGEKCSTYGTVRTGREVVFIEPVEALYERIVPVEDTVKGKK